MTAALHAPKLWAKAGTASARMPVTSNILMGLALGSVAGGFFKVWIPFLRNQLPHLGHDLGDAHMCKKVLWGCL